MEWPKSSWPLLLQTVLKGRAQEIYSSLSLEKFANYDNVKEAFLKAYELVPEAYRQKFRRSKKLDSQAHVEFAREKEMLFDRWCRSKEIGEDFKKLTQLILVEEFKNCVHSNVKTHLDEQKVENLSQAARLADDFALTHKMSASRSFPFRYGDNRFRPGSNEQRSVSGNSYIDKQTVSSKNSYGNRCWSSV